MGARMGKVIYQPWRKGPAQIIAFPVRIQRAWLICATDGGDYRGEVFGLPTDGLTRTAEGPRDLVLEALKRPENRRGLPIVPVWRCGA